MELPAHPFFIGVQFHPEFTSTPRGGHPLFKAFVEAALVRSRNGAAGEPEPTKAAACERARPLRSAHPAARSAKA